MFGDIVIAVKVWVKQQICLHTYKWVNASYRTNGSCSDFQECTKCERII